MEFGYDYLGRRVQKCVLVWDPTLNGRNGGWSDSAGLGAYARRFVWSGWLMLLELEGSVGVPPVSESIVRKYTWGLDLAGLSGSVGQGSALPSQNAGLGGPASLEGAGGIGGLLAMQAPGAGPGAGDLDAVYTYDANGNVGQLVAWAPGFGGAQGDEWHVDRLIAHYEYDPYGGVTAQSGPYAAANPVRFSTKYWDDETGLGYWGYRYYSPSLGRWISRDPIGQRGGDNVYRFVANAPIDGVDFLGLFLWGCSRSPQIPLTPLPGTICGPVPNANPTDADCCSAAQPTCAKGDTGGVICCNGRKVSCSWRDPPGGPGDPSIDACVIVHEDDHHDDVSCAGCPPGQICRPYCDPWKNPNNEECSASWKEIDCLVGQRSTVCILLATRAAREFCDRRVEDEIKLACNAMRNNPNCRTFPGACGAYGVSK